MHLAKREHLLQVVKLSQSLQILLLSTPFHPGLEVGPGCRLESAELSITESNSPSIPRQKRTKHKRRNCSRGLNHQNVIMHFLKLSASADCYRTWHVSASQSTWLETRNINKNKTAKTLRFQAYLEIACRPHRREIFQLKQWQVFDSFVWDVFFLFFQFPRVCRVWLTANRVQNEYRSADTKTLNWGMLKWG